MKNLNNLQLSALGGLAPVIFGWIALILSFFGFFYRPVLIGSAVLILLPLFYLLLANRTSLKFKKGFLIIATISFFMVVALSYFTTPSVFSGRDQGSFSNAAIILSKNHNLEHNFPAEKEFFKIYGPGTALNFPGFNYNSEGNLVPHFPLGYVSWLATFYSFFGIFGFVVANGISFFLFLLSFYAVARNYLRPSSALTAFFLVATSFVFSWFFKYTLSENLALGLIWFGISQFIFFLKEKKRLYLISFLLAFGLLLFVRIEAIAFWIMATIIFFLECRKERKLSQLFLKKSTLFVLILILATFIASFKINSAFYVNVAKGFLNSFSPDKNFYSASNFFERFFYFFRVLSAYVILNYIIIGFLGFFYFLKNKRKLFFIIPYLILLPTFIYLFNPSITLDHPWLLRRYLFAVIPVSILYTSIFLENFCRKKTYFFVLSFFLLLTNLMISFPYFAVQENKNLLPQVEKLSSEFGKKDLILIDRSATSEPWAMISGPMNLIFEKQAVYFFNPEDLRKIDYGKFNKIYLIIPDFNVGFYKNSWLKNKLFFVKNYTLENVSLNLETGEKEEMFKKPIRLPQYQKKYTYGKIYLFKN